jgi:hypothetical protein
VIYNGHRERSEMNERVSGVVNMQLGCWKKCILNCCCETSLKDHTIEENVDTSVS